MSSATVDLPIQPVLPGLMQTLRSHASAVLQAPPGAGKTTLVPLALLREDWLQGRIIMLEPRRLAARAAAGRMAALLGEPVGKSVGYRIRMESLVGPATRIEVVTEGILTRMLQHDPSLEGVGVIIFDEFHERSLQADLGLALCLDTQKALRPDLRLLVMSATLDAGAVAELMGSAPVISSQGRNFAVSTRYIPPPPARAGQRDAPRLERHCTAVIRKALAEEEGGILVFLPGAAEINRTLRLLTAEGLSAGIILAPLYGMLSRADQDMALCPAPAGKRKVVLATSIAETSLTIEGVRIVIDSGLMRIPRFDTRTQMTRLETVQVSLASADQRRGRAGRTAPGVCYRLWTPESEAGLAAFTEPEIRAADMAPLALELALWGISDPCALLWLDAPPQASFLLGRTLLERLDALDSGGVITPEGRHMAAFGLHPRLAHMLLRSRPLGLNRAASLLAALLAERDIIRERHGTADIDIRHRLELLEEMQAGKRPAAGVDAPLARRVLEQAARLEDQLKKTTRPSAKPRHAPDQKTPEAEAAGLLLAFAYPDRIGKARPHARGRYLLAGGNGAWMPAEDVLAGEDFIVAPQLDGNPRDACIFLAAPLASAILEEHFAVHIKTVQICDWDSASGSVITSRRRMLDALILEERKSVADNETLACTFLEGVRRSGLACLPWSKPANTLRARIAFCARALPDLSAWPDVSEAALMDQLETWLGPYVRGFTRLSQLAQIDINAALACLLTYEQRRLLNELAPTHICVPSGSNIPLDYDSAEFPVLAVRLQELFGLSRTPEVARGVPVILHLLSPAGRPMQVTRDLAGFWAASYHLVRKELRGRYPRHPWPEDPLQALPTKRAKPRKD